MRSSVPRSRRISSGALFVGVGSLLAASGMVLPTLLVVASVDMCSRGSLHCMPIGPEIWPLSGIQVIPLMLGGYLPGIHPGSTSIVTQTVFPVPMLILLPALLPLVAVVISACLLASQRGIQWLRPLWRVAAVLGIVSLGVNSVGVASIVLSEPAWAWEFPATLAGALMPLAYVAMLYGAFSIPTVRDREALHSAPTV